MWTHVYAHRSGTCCFQFVGRSTGESRRLIRLLFADWDRMKTIRRQAASLCSRGSCAHRSSVEDSFWSVPMPDLQTDYLVRQAAVTAWLTAQIKPSNSRAIAVPLPAIFPLAQRGGGSAHTVGSAPSRRSHAPGLRLEACAPPSRRRCGRAGDSSRRIQPASYARSCYLP